MKNLKFLTLIVLSIAGMGLSACETVKGAGQDIHNAGHAMEDAVE